MILLITYNLNEPTRNTEALFNEIKKAGTWWHHLDSTWLIKTNSSPKEWYNRIAPRFLKSDSFLIIEVKSNYYGWLPQNAWDWIQKQVV